MQLLISSALATSTFALCERAFAACDPLVNGAAACTGTFDANINYDTNNGVGGTPIDLTLQAVTVNSPGGNAVNAANTTGVTTDSANITISADGLIIDNRANGIGNNNTGLRIQSSGDAIVNATGASIDVNGVASDWAILVFAMPNVGGIPHLASVTWTGTRLSSSGVESGGIQVDNRGNGDALV
ncbi:hypothetical protein AB4144_24055, partial [Rhizobiaceae sp. 2RAB30]